MARTDIKVGALVKDRVTGFTGIAVCRSEWLNGCIRITVQPRELKDGKPIETHGFDVEELIVLDADAMNQKPEQRRTGGPMPNATRPIEPSR